MQQKHGERPNQTVNSLNQRVNDPLIRVIEIAKLINESGKGLINKVDYYYEEHILVLSHAEE